MKKNFVFTFIFAVTGAIIGAGFASGKEISTFFAQYGFLSILFVVFAAILFFWVFYLFTKIGKKIKPNSVSDISKNIFGRASIIIDFLFIISSLITLSSMLAGLDSTMQITFGERYIFPFASILSCVIVAIILNFGLKKIFQFTDKIIPFMLSIIFVVAIAFLIFGAKQQVGYAQINQNIFSLSVSPILYVCMNTFGNIFLVAKTGSYLKKKQIIVSCLISCVLLVFSIFVVLLSILFGGEDIFLSDMPMLSIAYSLGTGFGTLYFITLIVAIFTTVCTTAYSISCWLNNYVPSKFLCGVIVLSLGFVFSRFGFSTIVDIFYPLEGIFGFIIIVICSVYYLKQKRNEKKAGELPVVDGLEITKKNGQVIVKKKYRKKN